MAAPGRPPPLPQLHQHKHHGFFFFFRGISPCIRYRIKNKFGWNKYSIKIRRNLGGKEKKNNCDDCHGLGQLWGCVRKAVGCSASAIGRWRIISFQPLIRKPLFRWPPPLPSFVNSKLLAVGPKKYQNFPKIDN